VDEIAGDQNFVKGMRMAPQRLTAFDEELTLQKNIDGSLSMALDNQREYTAFQFDLYLPEGIDVTHMALNAERKQKHQLLYNKVEDGHYRVAAISTSNRTFNGNNGDLLGMLTTGMANGDIRLDNIHFFTVDGSDYLFDAVNLDVATGIENLTTSTKDVDSIYTLDGRRVSAAKKGIFIVNGKKVVLK